MANIRVSGPNFTLEVSLSDAALNRVLDAIVDELTGEDQLPVRVQIVNLGAERRERHAA